MWNKMFGKRDTESEKKGKVSGWRGKKGKLSTQGAKKKWLRGVIDGMFGGVRGRRKKSNKQKNGGKNLLILGVGAVVIALATTMVALVIYHNSGDIYLDRSRPGFLPDEAEIEEEEEDEDDDFNFEMNGDVTAEGLGGYLRHLEAEIEAVESYQEPFGEKALGDERLGIDDVGVGEHET